MRSPFVAVCLAGLSVAMIPAVATAAPVSTQPAASYVSTAVHLAGYRSQRSYVDRRAHRRRHPRCEHYRSHRLHLPGRWNHSHCHDWHRCHYYFYGYKQWRRWNPDKSKAYFVRRYHH